ncbi:hypothetical protein [Kitasatospora aureofaciens]|uniref:hypothetical protein n=1 Tax=Kitasatospora aureofaciens TaxID=1894 RepID=UPI001C48C92B|nr:hypothetical protein [Kitasatospora aureofaciens]MBV6697046.1 hypothetical protein [Kitasatospora aureofaciens]
MRPGTADFLIGAAFVALLALALATVVLGVIATLRMPRPDDDHHRPPTPDRKRNGIPG